MDCCTLAPHALHPHKPDRIYAANRRAGEAAMRLGAENVINATLGACIDDGGGHMILPTVDALWRSLPAEKIYNYAPITGVPGFRDAVAASLFGDWRPAGELRAIPTPGGTGAIRHLVWNFLDLGDPLLSTDWCWNPYRSICEEHGRRFETFPMFDTDGGFNLDGFARALETLLGRFPRAAVLLNSPGNNPTGYKMSREELAETAEIVRTLAKKSGKPLTVCLDLSYVDYDPEAFQARWMVECFDKLPENAMLTAVFSMSKSYTMSGVRCGALLAFTPNQEAAEEFQNTMAYSSRSTWSNTVRAAQEVLVEICRDQTLFSRVQEERRPFRELICQRGLEFSDLLRRSGVPVCPYSSGFFVALPHPDGAALAERLEERKLFAVPIAGGLRLSVCSTHSEKLRRAAAILAEEFHS